MRSMNTRTKIAALILSAVAFLAIAVLLLWLFSRQGTLGLFQWSPTWRLVFILVGAAGLLPLLLGLISLPRATDPSWKPGGILAVATIAFSALAIIIACGLSAFVLSQARSVATPIPAVRLVDPSVGIAGSGGVARISISSDPHWGAATSDAIARTAILKSVASASPRRDAFFILGDNVQMGMEDGPWRAEAGELGSILGELPVRPLLGNHDGLIDGQYHFRRYFFPAAMKTDSGSPYYYSMKAGAARIVVLNLLWGSESFSRAQADWLESTLASFPAGEQVIALSHAYVYSSGYKDPDGGMPWYDNPSLIERLAPILERHRVALLVSGHNHYMELLKKNGVTYAVIGAMGGIPDPEPSYRSPTSVWFKAGNFGRLDIDVGEAGLALTFRDRDGGALREDYIPAAR
jgi:hypothetical protein